MPVSSAAVLASVMNGVLAVIAGSTVGDAIAIVGGAFCSFVELSCSTLTCVRRVAVKIGNARADVPTQLLLALVAHAAAL